MAHNNLISQFVRAIAELIAHILMHAAGKIILDAASIKLY